MPDDLAYFCAYVDDLIDPASGRWIHTPFAASHDKIPVRMEACREIYVDILRQRMEIEKMRSQMEHVKRGG